MPRLPRFLIVLLCLLGLAAGVRAAVVTVSTTAALQSAVNRAASSDVVVLADGVYTDTTLVVAAPGITVRAATPGGVFLNGTNAITLAGDGVVFRDRKSTRLNSSHT